MQPVSKKPSSEVFVACHLLPGFFGDASERLLSGLKSGTVGTLRVAWDESGLASETPSLSGAAEVRKVQFRFGRGAACPGSVEVFTDPRGRRLVGLEILVTPTPERTVVDLQIVLLGLACASLAHDSQGAIVVGSALGPILAGVDHRLSVADQLRALINLHGAGIDLIVAAPDTAAALGELLGFDRRPLANLVQFQRR